MKKIVLVCGAALLTAGFYVWGSKPVVHVQQTSQPNVYSKYVGDTLPKKRDTLPHRDTTRRKDSLQSN